MKFRNKLHAAATPAMLAAFVFYLCFPIAGLSAENELVDMLIQQVRIVKTGAPSDTPLVNIQIQNGKVMLVSKDDIPTEDETIVWNANGGFLLGRLAVGAPPDFVILNGNPAQDTRILHDTKPHVRFAVRDGEIVRNELDLALARTAPPDGSSDKQSISYNPPPTALSTSYDVDKKWNAFDTKYFNGLVVSAVLLDRGNWLSQNEASRQQPGIGDLSEFDGGTIRGFRFGVGGTIKLKRPWSYNIAGAANAFDLGFDSDDTDSFTFYDYRVDIPISDDMTLSVGKQKEPMSMERSMTLIEAPVQERTAAADAMMPTRNVGVVLSGTTMGQRMTWATGVFNDWFDAGESFSESASQAVGRVTWLPLVSEDESNLVHLGFGVRYTDAKQGLRYKSRPEVGNAPNFVDTELFDANSSTLYNLEAAWRNGPYWITAEYLSNDVDAPDFGNPTFSGYHIAGTWSLKGEMRPYNRRRGRFGGLPVAQNIHQGGYGAVELGLRWSDVDLSDGSIDGGEMQIATVGVSWWLSKIFNVSLNYQSIWHDRAGSRGRADALVTRVMLATD
jgi:phosphate-selective porin OprO/OprP